MNQKITLRFADHVLTFVVPGAQIAEVNRAFRRKWPYDFTRADGNFHVNFDHVLWMKISPTSDTETKQETVPGNISSLFHSPVFLDEGKHGNL